MKQALLDERFRQTLPDDLKPDVDKFLKNPGCACNHPIYKKIIAKASNHLNQYYPTKESVNLDEFQKEVEKASENHWSVINCSIDELAEKLKKLPNGRKQLDIARFQDQVTVVINELDLIY